MKIAMFISSKKAKFPLALLSKLEKNGIKIGLIIYKRQISLMQIKKYMKRKGFLGLIIRAFQKPFIRNPDDRVDNYFEKYLNKEKIKLQPIEFYKIPIKSVSNLSKSTKFLKEYGPDLIIHAGGGLISKEIIGIPNRGIINCHPAILPKYPGERGHKNAFQNNEAGTTIHFIDEGIDTGQIIIKKEFKPEETVGDTKNKSMLVGVDMIVDAVKGIMQGKIKQRNIR